MEGTYKISDSLTVEIWHDEYCTNPMEDYSIAGFALTTKRGVIKNTLNISFNAFNSWEEVLNHLKKYHKVAAVLPVYAYTKSTTALSTTPFSCPWDSGQWGYVFFTKEAVKECWGWERMSAPRREKAEESLRATIATLSAYYQGHTYGLTIIEDGEEVDHVGGFIGDDIMTNGLLDYVPSEFHKQLTEQL